MISVSLLAVFLLVSIVCAFSDGVRGFGMGGLVFVLLVSGAIWAFRVPLA